MLSSSSESFHSNTSDVLSPDPLKEIDPLDGQLDRERGWGGGPILDVPSNTSDALSPDPLKEIDPLDGQLDRERGWGGGPILDVPSNTSDVLSPDPLEEIDPLDGQLDRERGWGGGPILDVPYALKPHEDIEFRPCGSYVPQHILDENKLIVCIIVHGTHSPDSEAFFESDKPKENKVAKKQRGIYQDIKESVRRYAETEQTKLHLISYRWSGRLNHTNKLLAGSILERFLRAMDYLKSGIKVILLTHSHGGNVANYVTALVPAETPIYALIHFACPARKDPAYQPAHYRYLFNFYCNDLIAKLGQNREGKLTKAALHRIKKTTDEACDRVFENTLEPASIFMGSVLAKITLMGHVLKDKRVRIALIKDPLSLYRGGEDEDIFSLVRKDMIAAQSLFRSTQIIASGIGEPRKIYRSNPDWPGARIVRPKSVKLDEHNDSVQSHRRTIHLRTTTSNKNSDLLKIVSLTILDECHASHATSSEIVDMYLWKLITVEVEWHPRKFF